jgi:xanthine dehydrogenase YagR molybdenum-binding subunit
VRAEPVDPRCGGFLNSALEEYPIAVNGDIHQNDAGFIDEPDPLISPVGVKGLGEVAMAGVSAAIATPFSMPPAPAFRTLPIHIEDVLTIL